MATAVAARKAMRLDKFDVLIIDLNLPDGLRDKPQIEGGLDLLDLLLTDVICRLPADIMFITAREDNVEAARTKAAERGAVLCQFGQGARPEDVEEVMIEFRKLQAKVRAKMSEIVYGNK